MQHVLRAVGANLPVIPYKTWGVWLPDGKYVPTKVEPSQPLFAGLMREMGGENAINEVAQLLDAMQPLCRAATALPPAALRAGDLLGTLKVAGRFFLRPELLSSLPYLPALSKPFAPILDKHVKDPFARNFLDLLCFLLAGVTADKIPTAEVAFMFSEWTGSTAGSQQSDSVLEHPVGGAAGIVDALVQVLERHGSILQTKSNVQKVLVEGEGNAKRAVGVQLKSGEKVMAREGVISNVSSWDFPSLFPDDAQESIAEESAETPMCPSFMHLHMAIEMTPEVQAKIPHKLEANYVSVEDWERGITSPDNVVLVSIPTVLEPSRAPQGFAVAHAYTPATEPYESWAGLRPESAEYEAMKAERSKVLWRAVEKIFGQDMRELAHVKLIGTPKTHERFLNRKFGTYGPMVDASESLFTLPLPHKTTAIGGLWSVGDSTFPGIGVPATAASAWLAANAFGQVKDHAAILKGIGL